jgi:hypothetical protein
MAELFLAMSGSLAQQIVAFYLSHQLLFNLVVVAYGVVLIVGHRNIKTLEHLLLERYGSTNWEDILTRFAGDEAIMEGTVPLVRPPFIASPYFFSLHPVRKCYIIDVIGKKHGVSRKILRELVDTTKE